MKPIHVYTHDEVLEKLKILYPDYLYDQFKYIGYHDPIEIGCLEHGYTIKTARQFLIGHGCKHCAWKTRRITQEEFLRRSKERHGNKYGYSKSVYTSQYTEVEIYCYEHGTFWQTPKLHWNHECEKCGKSHSNDNRRIMTEEVLKRFREKHGDKYDYLDFSMDNIPHLKVPIKIKCRVHGIFEVSPFRHFHYGCWDCGIEARSGLKYTLEEIIEKFNETHEGRYTYKNTIYTGYNELCWITCTKHGDFEQTPHRHIDGQGCRTCINKVSLAETEWLNILNIPLENRYYKIKIPDSTKYFYADGFDPITNTIYEYNGDYWHGNPVRFPSDKLNTRTGTTMGELYTKTLHKEQLLKKAGYNVVTMWESDWNNLMNQNRNGVKFTSENRPLTNQ